MKRLLIPLGLCLLASCAVVSNPKTQTAIACSDLDEIKLAQYALTRLVKRVVDDPNKPKPKSQIEKNVERAIETTDDDCFAHLDAKLKD